MNLTKKVAYFGLSETNDIYATNIIYGKSGTSFDVIINNKPYYHFSLPIYGTHQLLDALAVISVCYYESIEPVKVDENLKTFTGAKRRFTETIAGDSIIIDDYAHHPNEVSSTINAIK